MSARKRYMRASGLYDGARAEARYTTLCGGLQLLVYAALSY